MKYPIKGILKRGKKNVESSIITEEFKLKYFLINLNA